MPGIMIERPKMTRGMYQALKRHIMKEREKIKQEQEQDEALERSRKEKELEKKKKEEDSLNLEQTKDHIAQLESKLESLKQEKHKLFSQLKKVLHQEDENRKRAQLKEHNEMLSLQQQYHAAGVPVPGHPMFMQTHMQPRQKQYMNVAMHQPVVQQTLKRARSPSPPPGASIYPHYAGGKYPATTYAVSSSKQEPHFSAQKSGTAYPASSHVTYSTSSGLSYQQATSQGQAAVQQQGPGYQSNQSPVSKYATASQPLSNQSAFQSYSNHYAQHQKQIPEHFQAGYQVTRVPQPGFMGSPHAGSSLPLQQQLEHANQKSGFSDDKFKMQQVKQMRSMAPMSGQPSGMIASQMPSSQPSSQPPPNKGSIMSGYPVRTQAVTSQFQAAATPASTHTSMGTSGPPRNYSGTEHRQQYY